MRYLKTNTATTITVGPFLDNTDGITPETAITVTGVHLTLMVDNAGTPTLALDADATASGGSNDMAHVTNDDAGYYTLELTAANLNYIGGALLSLNVVGTACPVFHEFTILPAQVYDSLIAGSDLLDANASQLGGTAQTGRDVGASVLLSNGTGTGQVKLASGYVAMTWADIASPTTTVTLSGTTIKTATDVETDTADIQSKIGTPAGVSVSADVAEVKTQTAAIEVDTQDIQSRIPAALTVGGNIKADALAWQGAATATNDVALITAPSNFAALAITAGGAVTAGTVSDKTGYSLSQAFPSNFDALAITVGGAVTAGTVSDKTGYSLTQSFPTNFSAMGISAGGIVNADVVNWKAATAPAMTGDAFARLGAPAGASVSADVAAIKTQTAAIETDTGTDIPATLATIASYIDTEVAAIYSRIGAPAGASIAADIAAVLAKWTTAVTESYASDGSAPTPEQALVMILQSLHEFSIAGTTRTVKKLDGSTTAMTFTLDSATAPTSTTRAT